MSLKEKVLATMKSRDTESDFELYVTRTPGYLWALLFQTLHVHPIAVTLMSIVIGAAVGYFFYFDDLRMNLIGMALLVWANWYDCADGQLARMTGKKTLIGRILDGFAGMAFWGNNGAVNPWTMIPMVTRLLQEKGFAGNRGIERVAGVTVYPPAWFNPFEDATGRLRKTTETRSIHWYAKSWMREESPFRVAVKRALRRLLGKETLARLRNHLSGRKK